MYTTMMVPGQRCYLNVGAAEPNE